MRATWESTSYTWMQCKINFVLSSISKVSLLYFIPIAPCSLTFSPSQTHCLCTPTITFSTLTFFFFNLTLFLLKQAIYRYIYMHQLDASSDDCICMVLENSNMYLPLRRFFCLGHPPLRSSGSGPHNSSITIIWAFETSSGLLGILIPQPHI